MAYDPHHHRPHVPIGDARAPGWLPPPIAEQIGIQPGLVAPENFQQDRSLDPFATAALGAAALVGLVGSDHGISPFIGAPAAAAIVYLVGRLIRGQRST